jgi:hypothetical protein
MPTLSIFFGIIIRMWHDDHPPPHIHVEYQGFEALVKIATGEVSEGGLPRKVAAIVKEWCAVHQAELQDNWQRAQRFEPLDRIQGADRD